METHQVEQVPVLTAANALTAARLVLLPLVVAGIATSNGWLAVGAMAAALVTDLLDGRVARRLGQASSFGVTLDSTVDFILIYSTFTAFYAAGRIETYQFGVIYTAMLLNLALQLFSMSGTATAEILKTATGKLTGALQYLYLLFLVVREVLPRTAAVESVNLVIFWLLAAAIALNAVRIVVRLRVMSRKARHVG